METSAHAPKNNKFPQSLTGEGVDNHYLGQTG